jgi:carbon storage regulator CsrA
MLVLTLSRNDPINVGEKLSISLEEINCNQVKLRFTGPKSICVLREELLTNNLPSNISQCDDIGSVVITIKVQGRVIITAPDWKATMTINKIDTASRVSIGFDAPKTVKIDRQKRLSPKKIEPSNNKFEPQ